MLVETSTCDVTTQDGKKYSGVTLHTLHDSQVSLFAHDATPTLGEALDQQRFAAVDTALTVLCYCVTVNV